jgi:putative ABC transport system permease protein
MFYFTYLARELRRRLRQAIFIALGLAVGVGLVLTVTAASAGVKNAQAGVLKGLYGAATDITVTGSAPSPPKAGSPVSVGGGTFSLQMTPSGAQMCVNGKCRPLKEGYTIDQLMSPGHTPISSTDVAKIAKLSGVTAVAGNLQLTDNRTVISENPSPPTSFTVDGTDVSDLKLGPFSNAVLASGRTFTAADANASVAVVDKDYAISNDLKVGGTVTIGGKKFTIIGLVNQPEGATPPNMYIPLARAQADAEQNPAGGGDMKNEVNTIYVTVASAADVDQVSSEIQAVLPMAQITTPGSLASQLTGSISSAAKLANDLGKWLSVLVLIAAFAIAVLLTMLAVSRRVREFGTLKALGWRSGRIIAQVIGESLVTGAGGAAVGVGIGFAGVGIINAIAPKLSGILTQASQGLQIVGPNGPVTPSTTQTVSVPLSAVVGGGAIIIAIVLALAGGLLAGILASWRIGRLRPADAIAKVG